MGTATVEQRHLQLNATLPVALTDTEHSSETEWWQERLRLGVMAEDGTVWGFGAVGAAPTLTTRSMVRMSRAELQAEVSEVMEAVEDLQEMKRDGLLSGSMEAELEQSQKLLAGLQEQLEASEHAQVGSVLEGEWLSFARQTGVQASDTIQLEIDEQQQLSIRVIRNPHRDQKGNLLECVIDHELVFNDLTGWALWLSPVTGEQLRSTPDNRLTLAISQAGCSAHMVSPMRMRSGPPQCGLH